MGADLIRDPEDWFGRAIKSCYPLRNGRLIHPLQGCDAHRSSSGSTSRARTRWRLRCEHLSRVRERSSRRGSADRVRGRSPGALHPGTPPHPVSFADSASPACGRGEVLIGVGPHGRYIHHGSILTTGDGSEHWCGRDLDHRPPLRRRWPRHGEAGMARLAGIGLFKDAGIDLNPFEMRSGWRRFEPGRDRGRLRGPLDRRLLPGRGEVRILIRTPAGKEVILGEMRAASTSASCPPSTASGARQRHRPHPRRDVHHALHRVP